MGYYVQTTRSYKTIFVCPLLADNQKWLLIPLKYDRNNQATTTSNDKSNKKKCITFLYRDGNGNSIVIFYITEKTIYWNIRRNIIYCILFLDGQLRSQRASKKFNSINQRKQTKRNVSTLSVYVSISYCLLAHRSASSSYKQKNRYSSNNKEGS